MFQKISTGFREELELGKKNKRFLKKKKKKRYNFSGIEEAKSH